MTDERERLARAISGAMADAALDELSEMLPHDYRRGYRQALYWLSHVLVSPTCEESACQRFRTALAAHDAREEGK